MRDGVRLPQNKQQMLGLFALPPGYPLPPSVFTLSLLYGCEQAPCSVGIQESAGPGPALQELTVGLRTWATFHKELTTGPQGLA